MKKLIIILTLNLAVALAAFAQEKNPERNAYFGENAHPHQLVGGRLGHGQPHHRAG